MYYLKHISGAVWLIGPTILYTSFVQYLQLVEICDSIKSQIKLPHQYTNQFKKNKKSMLFTLNKSTDSIIKTVKSKRINNIFIIDHVWTYFIIRIFGHTKRHQWTSIQDIEKEDLCICIKWNPSMFLFERKYGKLWEK